MRKLIAILLTLTLPVAFSGCQSAAGTPAAGSTQNGSITPSQTTGTFPSATVTKEQAQVIALEHAGLTADQVTRLHTEPDRDDGSFHYDVEFHHGGFEYDYEISAKDGSLLKADKEKD